MEVLEDRCLFSMTSSLDVAIIGSPNVINGGYLPTDVAGINFTNVNPSNVNATTLAGYDTVVLNVASTEVRSTANLTASAKQSLVDFVGLGGKLIIYDSEQPAQDYSFLPYSFTTSNPGAMGAFGTLSNVEDDTLSSSDPADPYFIDVDILSTQSDAVGDANVFTSYDGHWKIDMVATNTLGVTGPVHVYSEYSADGVHMGLMIYNGLDTDYMDYAGAGSQLRKIWVQELNQQWDPSGLPGGVSVVGITLSQATNTENAGGTHMVTARLTDQLGNPHVGVPVIFTVTSGPNAGATGTCSPVDGCSDADGYVTFTYASNGSEGVDTIVAEFTNTSGVVIQAAPVSVEWQRLSVATTILAQDASGTLSGATDLVATLTDGSAGVPGETLVFTLNGTVVGSAVTDAAGVATLNGVSLAGIAVGTHVGAIGVEFAGTADYDPSVAVADLTIGYEPRVHSRLDRAKKGGSTLPIKIDLFDANGVDVSSPDIALTAVGISPVDSSVPTQPAICPGSANPDGAFRYDQDGRYMFNLKLVTPDGSPLSAGTYNFYYTIEGDPNLQVLTFTVR